MNNKIKEKIIKYTTILLISWTAILLGSLILNIRSENLEAISIAESVARNEFKRDAIFRQWNASHGGVYVPITEETPANPYLSHLQHRDITTTEGQELTLVNPAYMTRQLKNLSESKGFLSSHITSLNPVRPGNKADAWESEALKAFEQGVQEVIEITKKNDEDYVRLMRPFFTEQSCLKCHAEQGYELGDVRGGISVTVPIAPYREISFSHIFTLSAGYFLLWVIGSAGLLLGSKRVLRQENRNYVTQLELVKSENYYRTLLQSLHEDIIVIDREYKITDINDVALRTLNKKREDVIGKHCYEVSHTISQPCNFEGETCGLAEVIETGEHCTIQHEHISSDGQIKNVEIMISPVRDEKGEITHIIEAIRDVTELLEIQRTLSDNKELLENVAENYPNAYIAIVEEDYVTSFASGQEFKKQHVDPTDFTGKDIEEIFGIHAETVREFYQKTFAGQDCTFELYFYNQYQKYNTVPLYSDTGNINRILVVAENVTKAKKEMRLRELQLKLIEYSIEMTSEELLQNFIDEAEVITESNIGYFHFVDENQETLGIQTWSSKTSNKFKSIDNVDFTNPLANASIWMECLQQRKPIVWNGESEQDPQQYPFIRDVEQRHLVIPIFREKKIVALLGVGNKSSDYQADDIDILNKLANFAWDTVVRKQAEEALQASEEFLSVVYNNSDVGIFVIDVDNNGDFVFAGMNPVYEKITNVKAEHVIGIPFMSLTNVFEIEYLNYIKGQFDNCIQGRKIIETEFNIPEGEAQGWWFSRITPIVDKLSGVVNKIIGSNIIITEIKEAEKAVQASEAILKEAQKVAKLGHYIYNLETGFWSSSPGLDEVFGINENYLKNIKGWLNLIHHEDKEEMNNYLINDVLGNGERFDREYRIIDQNYGNVKWVHGLGDLKFDEEGNPIELFGIIRDITASRKFEDALMASESKFRSVIEQSSDAIYIYYQKNFDLINERFIELTGYTKSEIQSDSFNLLNSIAPRDRDLVAARFKSTIEDEVGPEIFEFTLLDKSGKEHNLHASIKEIDYQGDKAVLGIMRDISNQKKLEDQVRQMQKVESIGQLAGGIAHDFNNLLTPIIGNAELALMALDPQESLAQDIQEISEAANRARELTRQLLAYSRKQILEFKSIDLNKLIENLRRILRRSIREDVEIKTNYGNMAYPVQVDVSQTEQVILNLVVNAQDAMPFGGTVTIQTESVVIDKEYSDTHPGVHPGNYALLSVSDTGTGMDEETQKNIFEPFFTTKEQGKGTGLGLSTVYGIVKQHNGHIWVYSELDIGTTFKVYLPFSLDEISNQKELVEESVKYRGSENIFIVEDDPAVQKIARRILENYGYHVFVSEDGYQALSMINDNALKVDLLVTDVIMPNLNGRELHGLLSGIFPDQKVLYMSGYTRDVIAHHGVLEDGIDFISKPLEVDSFIKKVREILDR